LFDEKRPEQTWAGLSISSRSWPVNAPLTGTAATSFGGVSPVTVLVLFKGLLETSCGHFGRRGFTIS
jgi:hypothetical protein